MIFVEGPRLRWYGRQWTGSQGSQEEDDPDGWHNCQTGPIPKWPVITDHLHQISTGLLPKAMFSYLAWWEPLVI